MLVIPDHSIILAPSSLHLSLYEKIYEQKGNCLNIKVYSIETYLYSLFPIEKAKKIAILYAYKEALGQLSPTNTFFASRNDLYFLNACYEFIALARFMGLDAFPDASRKEKELKEVLDLLIQIDFPLLTLSTIKKESIPFEQIYILKTEQAFTEQIWTDFLIENGAHYLEKKGEAENFYYALANTRKEVEWIAQAIMDQKIDPACALIALNQEADRSVLAQILEAYRIPYTFLKQECASTIKNEIIACLRFMVNKNKESYLHLIRTLYSSTSQNVCQYVERFENVDLAKLSYEENALISEQEFLAWQRMEQEAKVWIESHAFLQDFSLSDMKFVFTTIQSLHPEPSEDDLSVFDAIVQDFIAIKEQIQTNEDLLLLIQYLEQKNFTKIADRLEGIRIGSRHDLCALFEQGIVLNAHAKLFPNLKVYRGLFDETYLRSTSFLSLKERLQKQRANIFSALEQVQSLYVLIPQSDYHGRSLDRSSELDNWIKKRPTFISLPDPYGTTLPTFKIEKEQARSLFFKDDRYISSSAKLNTFKQCPLRHYLRFGLQIKGKRKEKGIQLDKNVLAHILDQAKQLENKQFGELNKEEILVLVDREFALAKKIFPQKEHEFHILAQEFTEQIYGLLPILRVFEEELHLSLLNKEYEVNQNFQWDALQVDLKGPLAPYSATALPLIVQDPALEMAGIGDTEEGLGIFSLSLKQKAEAQEAYSISYRTVQPTAEKVLNSQFEQKVLDQRFVRGWQVQDLPAQMNQGLLEKVQNKVPTYQEKEKAIEEDLHRVLSSLSNGEILPIHEEGACQYCPYKTICRNGAIKKVKGENQNEVFPTANKSHS